MFKSIIFYYALRKGFTVDYLKTLLPQTIYKTLIKKPFTILVFSKVYFVHIYKQWSKKKIHKGPFEEIRIAMTPYNKISYITTLKYK